jgi:glycosyltransferase involved in cell wall biosynthesis
VGGVPSIVTDGVDGLLFEPGDPAGLALAIRSVFDDDALARSLGAAAHQTACVCHEPATVVGQMLAAYHALSEGPGAS